MHFYTINCFSVDLRAQHADLEKMLALNIRIDKLVLGHESLWVQSLNPPTYTQSFAYLMMRTI